MSATSVTRHTQNLSLTKMQAGKHTLKAINQYTLLKVLGRVSVQWHVFGDPL